MTPRLTPRLLSDVLAAVVRGRPALFTPRRAGAWAAALAGLALAVVGTAPVLAQNGGAADGSAEPADDAEAPAAELSDTVRIETSAGDIFVELDRERAPITVANFMEYVEDNFYDGTIFHRVIDNFMIQGGGFTPTLQQKPTREPIKNEWDNGLVNDRGTIAMARTNNPDSATAQFFINVTDNPFLSQGGPQTGGAGYAVFGRVVRGMEVVDAIRYTPTATINVGGQVRPTPGGAQFAGGLTLQNVPLQDAMIVEVERLTVEEAEELAEDSEGEETARPETADETAGE